MIEQCESTGLDSDLITHSIFLAGIRRQLRYLRSVPDAPTELKRRLSKRVSKMPGPWLSAVALWMRVTEKWRLWSRGSRWMAAYQVSRPTPEQLKLIGDLGLEITSNQNDRP